MCKVIEDMRREEREEGRQEGLLEGRQEGLLEGRQENMNAIARRMLTAGRYALEEIAEISGLSLDEVRKLQGAQGA